MTLALVDNVTKEIIFCVSWINQAIAQRRLTLSECATIGPKFEVWLALGKLATSGKISFLQRSVEPHFGSSIFEVNTDLSVSLEPPFSTISRAIGGSSLCQLSLVFSRMAMSCMSGWRARWIILPLVVMLPNA